MDRIDTILNELQGRSVLVAGLDRRGISTALALHSHGARVICTDQSMPTSDAGALEEAGIRVYPGNDGSSLIGKASLVVIGPQIRLGALAAPIAIEATRRGVPMVGELEMAYRLMAGRGTRSVMAITGTRGKTTTAALCTHLLRRAGHRVFLGGDNDRPLADLVLNGEEVDWAVLEVSSFQLEHLSRPSSFVPEVGVWLNLFPDRVDRHITMRNYGRIKRRLFEGMKSSKTGVFWLDDSNVNQQHEGLNCTISGVSRNPARVPLVGALLIRREITPNGWDTPFLISNERLADDKNAENAACAVCATLAAGVDARTIQDGLDSFDGSSQNPVNESRQGSTS